MVSIYCLFLCASCLIWEFNLPSNLKIVTSRVAGLILREIKDFWRVALFICTLTYPEVSSGGDPLGQPDELHQRKEKYTRAERLITELGKESTDDCRLPYDFLHDVVLLSQHLNVKTNLFISLLRFSDLYLTTSSPELDAVWKMKPLLDGKAIMGIMQVKGGPLIGKWVYLTLIDYV